MTADEPVMPCSEAVERLWEYLDRALSPEDQARLEQHLAFCRRCCGEMEFACELRAFLSDAAADEIPPDVWERLQGFVRELGG